MSASPPSVVCAGILVADVFVPPLERLPDAGELILTDDFLIDTGGCAANTATSLVKLGVSARVVGKVGRDSFGDFVEGDLRRKGVDVSGITRSATHGTAKTVILTVAGDDRRFVHTIGANTDFSVEDLQRADVSQARVFYLGGYLVLPGLTACGLAEALASVRAQGLRTVLDVAVPTDGESTMEALTEVLPLVDVFMPNDEEARVLTGEIEPRLQAARCLEAGCGTVIITMGAHGALLMSADEIIEMPAMPVDTVDCSGAGDAFDAGFIAGMLEGWDLTRTLVFASILGASACTRLGCTTGVFSRGEALAYMVRHAHVGSTLLNHRGAEDTEVHRGIDR